MTTTTTINESTSHNDDGSKTVTTLTETKYPDGTAKIVKKIHTIPPPSRTPAPAVAARQNDAAKSKDESRAAEASNTIGTDVHDDTFSVPVEWPISQNGQRDEEEGFGSGGGGGAASSPGKDARGVGDGRGAGYDDDDSSSDDDEGSGDDIPSPPRVRTFKWKLALLFLSSVYELISVITKSQLFMFFWEKESCFRCNDDNEDLITSLFISSIMFFIGMILKEAHKVFAAFLNVCCEWDIICGDETVWPRNVVTIPMYLLKSSEIVPSYRDDYEYEYSQTHTLLNLCVEDIPFLVFGIYGVQLDAKGAGFGVFISLIGVLVGLVEAIQHVRTS